MIYYGIIATVAIVIAAVTSAIGFAIGGPVGAAGAACLGLVAGASRIDLILKAAETLAYRTE